MYPKRGRVLRHPKLSHAELARLLAKQMPDRQAWCIVARITNTWFGALDKVALEILVTGWTQGQVFCTASEIRWQRARDSAYNDVLVLSEDPALQLEGFQPLGEGWRVTHPAKLAMLMAWGSSPDPNASHIRMESRLPKRLHYPPDVKEGRMSFLHYHAFSGEVQFLRLTGVT